ncbi:MAG: phosphotransferase [Gammaproteobacteria bacterium]|nr:phosphotransferase [Gammaproteobacteria bacterium]
MNWQDIAHAISQATGTAFELTQHGAVGGGCINTAMKISGSGREYFLKLNDAALLDMFEAEADGLRELAAANAVRVPIPVCTGISGHQCFIVMESLALGGRGGGASMTRFGEQLAQMHRHTAAQFGWQRDNTIGSTPQINTWGSDWIAFWREHRLGYQLQLAARNGIGVRTLQKGERLQDKLNVFFSGYQPCASVLHGDLWSGNYGISRDDEPVMFDPAVYYGDREADLAMTELFGGFGREFYAAYNANWPLDPGYAQRKLLYNLYHILNHFNLFGGGYAAQADAMIERLLQAC